MVVLTMLAVRRRTPIARTSEASAFLKILRSSDPQILKFFTSPNGFTTCRCAGRVRLAALFLGGVRPPEAARGSRAVDRCDLVDPSRHDDRARLVPRRPPWPLRMFSRCTRAARRVGS